MSDFFDSLDELVLVELEDAERCPHLCGGEGVPMAHLTNEEAGLIRAIPSREGLETLVAAGAIEGDWAAIVPCPHCSPSFYKMLRRVQAKS